MAWGQKALQGLSRISANLRKEMPLSSSGDTGSSEEIKHGSTYNCYNAYSLFEVVNRGVNLITDSLASIPIDIGPKRKGYTPVNKADRNLQQQALFNLLNVAPNPDQDKVEFFSLITTDFLLTGTILIYFDGKYLYRLPPSEVQVVPGKTRLIDHYIYRPNGHEIRFEPEEIIRVKENAANNAYIGTSRLSSALTSLGIMDKMNSFQVNYFKNGTVLGVVIVSKNILGEKTKEKIKNNMRQNYNPTTGARSPVVLDGDVDIKNLNQQTYRELDFDVAYKEREYKVLEALGVPPILIDSGNNANIAPNLKMFYLVTVMPILSKLLAAFERYFGYDLKAAIGEVPAMLPDLRERGAFLTSLVNSGILTRNEAREEIRYAKATDEIADQLILPANVAGSNSDPNVGGRPQNAPAKSAD